MHNEWKSFADQLVQKKLIIWNGRLTNDHTIIVVIKGVSLALVVKKGTRNPSGDGASVFQKHPLSYPLAFEGHRPQLYFLEAKKETDQKLKGSPSNININ